MQEPYLSDSQRDDIRKKAKTFNKYFTKVYMTVTAAAKMLNHAHHGQPK